jgi:hypothetical protein
MTAANVVRSNFAVAILAMISCSSTGIESFHDYNPDINFTRYQTWSFISTNPMIVSTAAGAVNPLLEGRIMRAVRADLTEKGFRYADNPESADFVVSFTVGSREQIKVDQYPASYQVGYSRYHRYGYGGYSYGMSYGTETRVRQYTQGQLAVDVFDVASRSPAFHGSATTRISDSDREHPEPLIASVVTEALTGFPPGSAAGVARPQLVPYEDEN